MEKISSKYPNGLDFTTKILLCFLYDISVCSSIHSLLHLIFDVF